LPLDVEVRRMEVSEAPRLREHEEGNRKLTHIVADNGLDNRSLKTTKRCGSDCDISPLDIPVRSWLRLLRAGGAKAKFHP
jgi:hypothetical protein